MFSAPDKIAKSKHAKISETDEEVAKALLDIEMKESDEEIKSKIKGIKINDAQVVPLLNGDKALLVKVPYKCYTLFKEIHQSIVPNLENKFGSVIVVAQRNIVSKHAPTGKKQKRPISRTLTNVHESLLEDVMYPYEMIGKRIRVKIDGTRLMKILLDEKEKDKTEDKVELWSQIYHKLTAKKINFTYQRVMDFKRKKRNN